MKVTAASLLFAAVDASFTTVAMIPGFEVAAATHYGNPFSGSCEDDEMAIQITGVDGAVCAPECTGTTCPSDVPDGVTATPTCALQTTTGDKYCALICSPSTDFASLRAGDAECGDGSCKALSGVGLCTYDKTVQQRFKLHTEKYGLAFAEEEYTLREAIFRANEEAIAAHNADAAATYELAMNQFGHLTLEEFQTQYTGYKAPSKLWGNATRKTFTFDGTAEDLADSVDWIAQGAVTDVKNQASCGSCWAFSTTGSLEGAYFLKNKKLVSFSEQQLVSCDDNGDEGCNGGIMENAFEWITNNGGLCAEADYPYASGSGKTGTCSSTCTAVANSAPKSYVDVAPEPQKTPASVEQMAAAVMTTPVSVAIAASGLSFQFYSKGVMTGRCTTSLDHGVLVTGYGTDSGTDYWTVKNSWGASWGEKGYIRLEKGKSQTGGQCGILLTPTYPVLA